MMKLLRSPPLQNLRSSLWVVSRLSTVAPSPPPGWSDSLFNRLVLAGDPRVSIVPVLDNWVEEGKSVDKRYLQWMVKQMRAYRRYSHALQISTWMSDRRYFQLSPGDLADRVDLLSRVQGIQHAENYFNSISQQLKHHQPYGALLNCYAEAKAVEKAESLFREMKSMNLLKSFSYNVLIKLYSLTGNHTKVKTLFHEMEEAGIPPDSFTYSILVEAHAVAADISGMEEILRRTELSKGDAYWHIYAAAAKGYSKAGLIDKALVLLKKSEAQVPLRKGRVAYGFLLTLYGDIGMKDELYRLWNLCKASMKATNSMYMCMMSSLLKLDDIKGAEEVFKEWEVHSTFYDFRVPNLLVAAYCKKGLLNEAEALVIEAIEGGRTPFANTWDRLAGAYFGCSLAAKAVEMMKKALVAARDTAWKPDPEKISVSLKYFKEMKDTEGAEEFVALLRHLGPLTEEVYHFLVDIYTMAGKPVSGLLHRMEEEGFDGVGTRNNASL